MTTSITRREMLGTTVAAALTAAGIDWIYARNSVGRIVIAAGNAEDWKPILFNADQANSVAALCEAIIPRTDTPGARDARAHEFIDLQLSGEAEIQQRLFMEGLDWLEKRCKSEVRKTIGECSPEELAQVLEPISDTHDKHPDNLKDGASFFGNLKRRTIFAFYTSEEGWVQDLGMPAHPSLTATMEGCHEEPS